MSCFLVPSPAHPGMFKYAMMPTPAAPPRVMLGYNYAAGPATAPTAVPMTTRFPRQPAPAALTTGPTTSAFLPTTNPVLTAAVPGQPPTQFGPPFTPSQTLLAAGPPFTRTVRPPFHKPSLPGKGLKRKLDDMKDKSSKTPGQGGTHPAQNLYCKVCCVTLNAPLQAKQHFEGKNHAKKLKMFTDEKSATDDSKSEEGDKKSPQSASAPTTTGSTTGGVSGGESSKESSPSPLATETVSASATASVTSVTVTTVAAATTISCSANSTKSPDTSKVQNQVKDDKPREIRKPLQSKQSPSTKAELNPEIYCKICGVSFNSPKQAQQHYQGKNHTKRVRAVNNAAAGNNKSTEHMPPGITKQGSKFNCVMCDLQMTSQAQLDNHLKGTRHLAQVQMAKRQSSKTLKGPWGDIKYAEGTTQRLLEGIKNSLYDIEGDTKASILQDAESQSCRYGVPYRSPPKKPKRDFSMYRTPSGKYYCSRCNVTLNSEAQFSQHFDSKKHKANNLRKYNESDS